MPGVMITQYVMELPRGKTTPDFTRKPIALTVQEGIFMIMLCLKSNYFILYRVKINYACLYKK